MRLVQFPYYTFVDRSKMYSVGSLFYAIYFFVSFPMFMRIEEDPKDRKWSLGQVSIGENVHQGKTPACVSRNSLRLRLKQQQAAHMQVQQHVPGPFRGAFN